MTAKNVPLARAAFLALALIVLPAFGQVRITEFMASNTRTLADEDGDYSDWIELQNTGTNTVNLGGWFLTDSTKNLRKWTFPATNLPPGQFMVVFASGKNRVVAGTNLHTSFRLDSSSGYLALVMPDGLTVASEFAPTYPVQVSDVSYGFGIEQSSLTLLPTNELVRAFIPPDATLSNRWMFPDFDDSTWISGVNGVGYDTGAVNPGEDLAASVIQASGPALFCRLNETSSTVAVNLGTNGVHATYQGGAVLGATGPQPPTYGGFEPNNAASQLNGTSAYIGSGTSIFNGRSAFTMSGWFQPTASPAAGWGLFGQNDVIEFGFDGPTAIRVWTFGGGSASATWAIALNQWHHVTVVGDGTSLKIYTNGVLAATGGVATSSYGTSAYPFNIGGGGIWAASGNFFNGLMDEIAVWLRPLSASEVQQQYQASLVPVTTTSYTSLIGTDVRVPMQGNNSSCYLRESFQLADPSQVDRLVLRVKYDDGFAAYLNGVLVAARNAPASVYANPLPQDASATTYNSDGAALAGEEINLSAYLGALRIGTNVLAIQGLNTSATNSDFLIHVGLTATSVGEYTAAARYFTLPTPGAFNGAGVADLGPIISSVGRSPAPPALILTNTPITVTARVQAAFAPLTNVTLFWRVMWGVTNALAMADDGLHGDGAAGDGVFGATIPASVATPGQMVRWFIQAQDNVGRLSRWPLYANPLADAEYEGTMIHDPSVTSQLQIWHFFIDPSSPNLAGVDTEGGGRLSMSYAGAFYDNIYMELRGNTTAGYPKKSHRLEFTADHPLINAVPGVELRHTSLLSEQADPSYLRTHLSFWLLSLMGVPSPFDYPVHCRLNGQFWGLWFHNDVLGSEQLSRLGYDPLGALYKAVGTAAPDYASSGGFEKKTRLWETRADYDALAYGINEARTLDQRKTFIFDNLNLPEIVNYLATVRWTQEGDDVWANMSLYRDTLGTKEWFTIPFDLNVSWGQLYCGDSALYTTVVATNDLYKCHPLYGGSQVREFRSASPSAFNRIYDVIIAVPETRQMLLRRQRTMMEKFIQPPGTPFAEGVFEQHIAAMTNAMWTEMFADRTKNGWPCTGTCGMYCWGQVWPTNATYGVPGLFSQFIEPRRTHFWVTHAITNTAFPVGLTNTANAGLPIGQPTAGTLLTLLSLDYNPASSNQAQEYVCLTNTSGGALDISGWQVAGGVSFTFKPGTVVPANGVVYVSPDLNAFRARTAGPRGGQGLFVVGPCQGQLSARGESILVKSDTGSLISSNAYPGSPSLAQQYLRVVELMYAPPPGGLFGAEEYEYIELKNISTNVTLNLAGVHFTNGVEFTFTGSTITNLGPQQTVLVVKNIGAFGFRYGAGFTNLAGSYAGYLDNGGERLQLGDAFNEEILDFTYNNSWHPITDGLGFSLVVVDELAQPDAWDSKANWRPSGQLNGTPGGPDPGPPALAPILVNEALTHTDPPGVDAIELFNPSSSEVNVGGWFLTDDFRTPRKYRIPEGTVIPAGAFHVFTETNFNPTPGVSPSFALSADGDEVYVFSGDASTNLTGYYHGFGFGAEEKDVTLGRYVNSQNEEDFVAQATPTLGTNNAGPLVGPVVVSEIMYHPPALTTNDPASSYLELLNIAATNVPLFSLAAPTNAWRLRNAVDFDFPTNVWLEAGQSLLVVGFDPATDAAALAAFRSRYGVSTNLPILGPWQGSLANDQDTIELKKPDLPTTNGVAYVMVEKVHYRDSAPWPSLADGAGAALARLHASEYANDPTNWTAALPSPGTHDTAGQPPVITVQPQSQAVVGGSNVTLSVSVTGDIPLSFRWNFNGTSLVDATNATLQLTNVQRSQGGAYQVLVMNPFGAVMSEVAYLAVPVVITRQPQGITAFPNTPATLSAEVFGDPPLYYQWRLNGTNVPGATSPTLAFSNLQPTNAGTYTLLVSNPISSVLSAPATISLILQPIILTQPRSQDVLVSNSITLSVVATSSTALTFQWRFNGTNLPGLTNSTALITTNFVVGNEGPYTVLVGDAYGSILSDAALLVLKAKPSFVVHPQPTNTTVLTGSSVSFSTSVAGSVPLMYRWRKDSLKVVEYTLYESNSTFTIPSVQLANAGYYDVYASNVVGNATSQRSYLAVMEPFASRYPRLGSNATFTFVAKASASATPSAPFVFKYRWYFNNTNLIAGATNFTLTVTNAQFTNEGTYTVVATNLNWTVASQTATLAIMRPPTIAQQPSNTVAVAGTSPNFTVVANGGDPYGYQWRFNGSNLPGATAATLTLNNVQGTNDGSYRVVVTNAEGSVTSEVATLTVLLPPYIIQQPTNQAATAGANVTLEAVAGGTGPLSYQWWFNQTNVLDWGTASTMTLTNAQSTNEGAYQMVVSNAWGVVTSQVAAVTVAPSILITCPSNLTVNADAGQCQATGAVLGTPETGGNPNVTNDAPPQFPVGTTTVTWTVTDGNSNVATCQQFVTVLENPPVIAVHPTNQTKVVGATVAFGVAATSCGPLTYQWLFNSTNLTGATNATLSFPAVEAADAGTYRVVVSNQAGLATSEAALLVVVTSENIRLEGLVAPGATNDPVTIRFAGVAGMSYTVQYRDALETGPWQSLTNVAPLESSQSVTVQDHSTAGVPQRFYRIAAPMQP